MTAKTKIEWCDTVWNPVTGCTKVSPGCKYCYAEREWTRLRQNPKTVYYRRAFQDVQCHPERLEDPLRWRKPRLVFVNSMSDLFHEKIPKEFISKVLEVMNSILSHQYIVLTKRDVRMREIVDEYDRRETLGHHIWFGVSIENRDALSRLYNLRWMRCQTRIISFEPLLEDLGELYGDGHLEKIDWVIAGGETGTKMNCRPMQPAWAQNIRDQCIAAKIPFFFKQLGGPKKTASAITRTIDGRLWEEFPDPFRD